MEIEVEEAETRRNSMTTDAQILSALRAAGEGSVSGAELSHQLGVSRAAIWARIEELRRLGYDIETKVKPATKRTGHLKLAVELFSCCRKI